MEQGIIVLGAGGHAKVCIELLRAAGQPVAFCVDAGGAASCVGVPVLDGDHHLPRLYAEGYRRAFVAIGANRLRAKLGAALCEQGYELVNAISPKAVVSPSAELGAGVAIMAGAVVNAEATIGDLAIINTGATIDHDCVIGAAAHVAPQCALAGNVTLAACSFLGVGCKVIPGVTIGTYAIVGAGAVVISDIGAGVTALGIPARPKHATASFAPGD